MELEKRVEEIETELKVMKGEIKELLVDIRDLVNKNENPFCSFPCPEALKSPVPVKDKITDNQPVVTLNEKVEHKPSSGVSEPGDQIIKNDRNSLKPCVHNRETCMQNAQRQEIYGTEPWDFRKIDIFMIVELMRWVDYAVRTVGHNNLSGLLNLYALTGQLPEETEKIIENIAKLSIENPAEEENVNMKDNITVLSQLSAILNPEGFKNIQPLYETAPGRKYRRKEKKTGNVSIEFEAQKELKS
ncbi:hypothetical protein RSJ42_10750 [Methanosarcina hadiensis]|uniref:hypothetical protein n=1 Tax=Methanosarcina hadiensis TaxID=3078083 RepID=UPI003977BD95